MGQHAAVVPEGRRNFKQSKARSSGKDAARPLRLKVDVPLLAGIVALLAIGLVVVFTASWDFSWKHFGSPTEIFSKQVLWVIVGVLAAAVLTFIDYRLLAKLVVPAMLVTIAALFAVLMVSDSRHGAVRTFLEGSIQPSELAKLVIILYVAVWLYSKKERLTDVSLGLIPLGVIMGIVAGLILNQPDLSAALTICFLGGMLFFLAGGEPRQILFLVIVSVIMIMLLVQFNPTGSDRIGSWVPGLVNPLEASYHVKRSLGAFVNGGWWGTGITEGTVKLNDLPLPHNDSIYAVIGEEFGVLGAVTMVFLYGFILWRGLLISKNAPDELGKLLAAGLISWLVMEAFFNMAGMLGLLPFPGNALPFISAGGSNMLVSMAAVGILLNISRLSVEKSDQEERRSLSEIVGLRRWDRGGRVSRTQRTRAARRNQAS